MSFCLHVQLWYTYMYVYTVNIEYLSGCACIPTVKKHALISEGVLIFECFV